MMRTSAACSSPAGSRGSSPHRESLPPGASSRENGGGGGRPSPEGETCRMKHLLVGLALLLGVGAMSNSTVPANGAENPLLFVSSFAAGEEGGIQAFRLDAAAGTLTP